MHLSSECLHFSVTRLKQGMAKTLRETRSRLDLSQEAMAALLGYTVSYYGKLEREDKPMTEEVEERVRQKVGKR